MIIGVFLVKLLTNIILDIEVIHSNKEIRNIVITELEKYGIKKYKFKKNYFDLQEIKKYILDEYKDKIEWIEIENKGTKYIVRVEERKINIKEENNKIYNIVAKKDGIIKKIEAQSGDILVKVNDFVKKDQLLISSEIKLNEDIKGNSSSKGNIYAEVWYNVKVSYPFVHNEIVETGNVKNVYALKFLDKTFELSLNKYKDKNITEKKLISFFPFSFVKQNQKEIKIIDEVLTEKEAISYALEKAEKQISNNLKDDEYILYQKILLIEPKDSKIIVDVFFSVYENITSYVLMEE